MKSLAPIFAILWAGLALGATLIATPVKFLAPSLSLSTALEIGRVTFYWVGIAETALCISLVIAIVTFGGIRWRYAIIPIALFAIQRVGLMPVLDARTVEIIAGNTVEKSNLHNFYIYLEFAKFFALIAAGAIGISANKETGNINSLQPPALDKTPDHSEEIPLNSTTRMQATFVDGALQLA